MATDPTHVHLLVSWSNYQSWESVRSKLKNLMSWALSKEFQEKGRNWFVRSGSRKRVENRRHFDYLMNVYFPKHQGLSWCEGDEPPLAPPSCERKPQQPP